MASNAAAATCGAQELSYTWCLSCATPMWAPRLPVAGLGMPQQALEAALCTGQACLGIAAALKVCGCLKPAAECG